MKKKVLVLSLFLILATCVSCKDKTSSSSQNSEVISNVISSENTSSNFVSSFSDAISSNSSVSSSQSSNSSTNNSSSIEQEVNMKLETPNLQIDEDTGVVTWDEVEGATHYNYVINDGEVQTTVSRTITLKNQENVSVQASNDTSFSDFSNAITHYDTSDVEIELIEKTKVYFHNSNISPLEVEVGKTISRPSNPIKVNHTFDDWYKDPFYQEKFDFSTPIEGKTIVYANFTPNDLVENTYYWIKGSSLIISEVSSSSTGWKFIPLKRNNGQTTFREFYATVQVNGASETTPAQFIVMDGFSDDQGRTYWKNGAADFTIKSDGTYNIYFSAEHQYSQGIHILVSETNNAGVSYLQRQQNNIQITTPVVEVNNETNSCTWAKDNNAVGYEVVIDNNQVSTITTNTISLSKGSHISVRSVYSNGSKSNWSIPKANINYIIKEQPSDGSVYVYFKDSNKPAIKLNKGETVEDIILDNETHRSFEGWYLEPSLKTKVTFPYVVNENTILYPKWNYGTSKEYYYLVDSAGTKVGGFTWNYDNYDFLEYELKYKVLDAKTYYIKSIDNLTTYSTFSIGKKGTYSIYFSEENLWDHPDQAGQKRNIYIRHDKTDFYFTNSLYWSNVYAYYWKKSNSDAKYSWPGTLMEKVYTNDMGQDVYKVSIDLVQYDYIVFNNGSGQQSVDVSLTNITNNAFYVNSSKDSAGHYTVGTWNYQG